MGVAIRTVCVAVQTTNIPIPRLGLRQSSSTTTLLGGPGSFNFSTYKEWDAQMKAPKCNANVCYLASCDNGSPIYSDVGCLHEKIHIVDSVNRTDPEVNQCYYKTGLVVKDLQKFVQSLPVR